MYQSTYSNENPAGIIAVAAARAGLRTRVLSRTLRTWRQRSEQRRTLSQLDQHRLDDIGITSQQLYEEIRKPFWRA